MTYDIGLTCGIEDKTKEGAASIANNLKKIAAVVAGGYGINKAFENMFKYGEAIKKHRTFEMMGGSLTEMRRASRGVVTDMELMALYTQLASRNMSGYATQIATAAGRLNELGIDPEVLMKASAGGKLGLLQRFLPGDVKSKIKGAKDEASKLKILLAAINGKGLERLSGYNTITDKLEELQTVLKNISEGPAYAAGKSLFYAAGATLAFASALKYLGANKHIAAYIRNIGWSIGEINDWFTFRNIEVGRGILGGVATQKVLKPFMSLGSTLKLVTKWAGRFFAAIYVGKGILSGLGIDIGKTFGLLAKFMGGLDMKGKKFLLSPQTIGEIKAAGLTGLFQMIGKATLFLVSTFDAFTGTLEMVGWVIGKIISPVKYLGRLLGFIGKDTATSTGSILGFTLALVSLYKAGAFLIPMVGKLIPALKNLGKTWRSALGIGLLLIATDMWIELTDAMGGWDKLFSGIVELAKWGWESIGYAFKKGWNAIVPLLNMMSDAYNWYVSIAAKMGLASELTGYVGRFEPYDTARQNVGGGSRMNMSPEAIEKNYQDARNTINKLNAESAAKKAKEGDVNVNVNIDGTKIDQVRHSRTRSQQAKTVGVKQ